MVSAQTTYANLLQFEIESKRLGNIKGITNNAMTSSGTTMIHDLAIRQQRRKKVRGMKLALVVKKICLIIAFYLF